MNKIDSLKKKFIDSVFKRAYTDSRNNISKEQAWLKYYKRKRNAFNSESDKLVHHGIKGQKWSERNGPPYPLKSSQKSSEEKKEEKYRTPGKRVVTKIITGHNNPPKHYLPNGVIDHARKDGSVKARAFYDDKGMKVLEIHTNDHGNSGRHPYGINGEHVHVYKWNADGTPGGRTIREVTDLERKENSDIL